VQSMPEKGPDFPPSSAGVVSSASLQERGLPGCRDKFLQRSYGMRFIETPHDSRLSQQRLVSSGMDIKAASRWTA